METTSSYETLFSWIIGLNGIYWILKNFNIEKNLLVFIHDFFLMEIV